MAERKTYRKMIAEDLKSRSAEIAKSDQRKDWGFTNQYRRMMQRRLEKDQDLTA